MISKSARVLTYIFLGMHILFTTACTAVFSAQMDVYSEANKTDVDYEKLDDALGKLVSLDATLGDYLVTRLIDSKATPEVINRIGEAGALPEIPAVTLAYAIDKEQTEKLESLLEWPSSTNGYVSNSALEVVSDTIIPFYYDGKYLSFYGRSLTAIYYAAWNGNERAIRALASAGAYLDPNISNIVAGGGYRSPLMVAIERGHSDAAIALLDEGASPNYLTSAKSDAFSSEFPLLTAIENGNLKVVSALVKAGAYLDPFFDTKELASPLVRAIELGEIDVAKFLIGHGAQVNRLYQGRTPLHYAIEKGTLPVVEALVENGAYVNYSESYTSPLLYANRLGRSAIADYLQKKGATIPQPDLARKENGSSPFLEGLGAVVMLVGAIAVIAAADETSTQDDRYSGIGDISQRFDPNSKYRPSSVAHSPSENAVSTCTSDYQCGVGEVCVKAPYNVSGECMKEVNEWGNPTNAVPDPNSWKIKTEASCSFDSDCGIGFRCDTRLKACVK